MSLHTLGQNIHRLSEVKFAHLLHSVLQLYYLGKELSDFLLMSEQLHVLLRQLFGQRHHLAVGLT